jgi:hypothetical protein
MSRNGDAARTAQVRESNAKTRKAAAQKESDHQRWADDGGQPPAPPAPTPGGGPFGTPAPGDDAHPA